MWQTIVGKNVNTNLSEVVETVEFYPRQGEILCQASLLGYIWDLQLNAQNRLPGTIAFIEFQIIYSESYIQERL